MLNYHARYYDSALGRFVSADTVVPNFANPQIATENTMFALRGTAQSPNICVNPFQDGQETVQTCFVEEGAQTEQDAGGNLPTQGVTEPNPAYDGIVERKAIFLCDGASMISKGSYLKKADEF